jgi:hypothetical protein
VAKWQTHLIYASVAIVVIVASLLALGLLAFYTSPFIAAAINLAISRERRDGFSGQETWVLPIIYPIGIFPVAAIPLYLVLSKI